MPFRNLSRLLFTGILAIGLAGCDVDVEDPGEAPSVDVDPGESPEVDVRGPEVDVETERKRVTVPDVDVDTEEKEVDVPDVDVDFPEEQED